MVAKELINTKSIYIINSFNNLHSIDEVRIKTLDWINRMFENLDDKNIEQAEIELNFYKAKARSKKADIPSWFERFKKDGFYDKDKRSKGVVSS